jgi:hypothetical protein
VLPDASIALGSVQTERYEKIGNVAGSFGGTVRLDGVVRLCVCPFDPSPSAIDDHDH